MSTIGSVLHHLRVYAGLSLEEVAEGSGYPASWLARVEAGDATCSPALFSRIAEACVGSLDQRDAG
jgi:transcriptional regulator with XRE-family HTH domain